MKTFLEFHRTYLFASKTLIQLATDRLTNNRAYQISQAKLAIAIANQKLEKLESPVSVFRTLSEYETELPNVGELREELTVLNRRLVAACRVPDILPSKRDKRRAIEQVKDVVEGVVLNLNPESVIKWNPQLSLLEKHLLSRFPYLSEQENLVVEGVIFGMGSTWYNVTFSGEYDTLMEPIIQRVGGGIVTRNSYGVLVLNSPSVMFVDIDIEGEDMSCRSRFGGDIKSAVNLIEAFTKYSGLAFQVYKTKNGLRLLELSRTWDARGKDAAFVFDKLDADPLFAQLCKTQGTFRARLEPKPWRVRSNSINAVAWNLGVLGQPSKIPLQVRKIQQYHDGACCTSMSPKSVLA
ncbi:hypothetical protein QUB19_15485 [Microcoleus sp. B4-C5]|uniref:hypothetical protein n=1 Tax=unclassified Microcoleus TaxID=2642155 RepID=UPI002FD0168C